MRFAPNARPKTMAREDKEARLKAFIRNHIETFRASGAAPAMTTYRLLALSAESPAARALGELAPELSAAGIHVEAVLARRNGAEKIEGVECRFVNDLRLLDAHEQLVLDRVTAWIGDCMRRDPLKRDAYELFCDRCAMTASNAARSFAHIWSAAGPKGSLTATPELRGRVVPNLFDPSLLAGNEIAAAPVLLRH